MKQVLKIGTGEGLDTVNCMLIIELGEKHCCIAIADHHTKTLQQLTYYSAEESDNGNLLEHALQEQPQLKESFHDVRIGYYMPESVMVPAKFYRYEDMTATLRTVYDNGANVVISDELTEWQMYNAYHVPAPLHDMLGRRFSAGRFWHSYSAALKNIPARQLNGMLLVDFKTDSFSLIVLRGNNLLLAQMYTYATDGDVLYRLLLVCKEFSLSQNEVQLVLSGLIEKDSALYKELYLYFLNVDFAEVAKNLHAVAEFDQYPAHFFSSIHKLAACES